MADSGIPRVGQKLTLNIGVLDQPYRTVGMTTGDVAHILEEKYGLFQAFYDAHQEDIADSLVGSLKNAFEALAMGHAIDPWGSAMQEIAGEFRDFISSREAERVGMPGVPTKAALRGVNHRKRHPYARRGPRPSFLDTGLLMTSGHAWMTSE